MKLAMIVMSLLLAFNVLASKKEIKPVSKVTPIENCFKSDDSLEREFCIKKRMKAIDEQFQTSLTKFKEGYTQSEKDEAKTAMNRDIEANKEMIKLLNDELKLKQDNLAKLETTLSNEEKEKAEQEKEANKQKEDVEKVKKVLKKIFK